MKNENAITINPSISAEMIIPAASGRDNLDAVWAQLFDVRAAVRRVDHIISDKGSDRTAERHTRRSYGNSLGRFIEWAGGRWVVPDDGSIVEVPLEDCLMGAWHRFPGPELLREYITHMKGEGLKAGTINRHLAPIRHYLKALRLQIIPARGEARDLVNDCKDWLLLSLEEKPGEDEEMGNNLPAMYQHGKRLRESQVRDIFASIMYETTEDGEQVERDMDLLDLRDLALLYVGFNTGLRDAELRRMTVSGIKPGEHNSPWQIEVRGKRNNRQPVPLDSTGYALIMRYVEAYNAGLAEDDERRIGREYIHINRRGKEEAREVPIFQPLRKGGHYNTVGVNGFEPTRGMGDSSVWSMVRRRSYAGCGVKISPHDMRRTVASIARQKGMGFDVIKMILRHKSISTTERYVGNPPDLGKAMLSGMIDWGLGQVA